MTVTADRDVVPEVTCAEFEMWSQVCPGAMTAVSFYPAPLSGEKRWWLGIGRAGGADDANVEWRQSWHLFNPGPRAAAVTLSFLGAGRTRTHRVEIPAGAVRKVESADIRGLPKDRLFVVRADADRAFCAQSFVRTFTRRLPHTRAAYSMMGTPMRTAK